MSFWKITANNKPEKVSAAKLRSEQILEKHLEDWIENSADIPGEPLGAALRISSEQNGKAFDK